MTTPSFNFAEMVCFSLYSTSNAMIREYRPQLDKFELTYPQFLVMMSLWNNDSVSITDLTGQILLDAATLTAILKRLENKKYIRIKPSPLDKRAKLIMLTKPGKDLRDKTSQIFENMECRIKLSSTEQKQLISTCNNILSRLT